MTYNVIYRDINDGSEWTGDLQDYTRQDVTEMTIDDIIDLYKTAQDVAEHEASFMGELFGFGETIVGLVMIGADGRGVRLA